MSLTRFTSEAFSTAVSRKITQYKYIYILKKHFSGAAASKYTPAFSSWTTGYYSYTSYK